MSVETVPVRDARTRPAPSWYWFAASVFAAIIVAEYEGPIIGIAFAMAVAGSALLWARKLPTPRFPAVGYWLIAIMIVGLVSTVYADLRGVSIANINLERDVGTVVSYVVYLVIGYLFAYDRSTFRILMVSIVLAGVVISAVQLVRAGIVVTQGVSDLYLFRLNAGRGSQSQVAGLCACLILLRDRAAIEHRRAVIAAALVCVASMLSVLGRGLMLDLIVLAIVVVGLTSARTGRLAPDVMRLGILLVGVATVAVGLYVTLQVTLPAVRQFIDEFFITKVQNSVREVSGTGLETRSQIAANYRAFEMDRAVQQFDEQPQLAQWLGQGWGSTVAFGFETAATKANFSRTEAPFLHNGYANYLMKIGVVGLLLYVGFLWSLILQAWSPGAWPNGGFSEIRRKVLLAAVLVLAMGSVTGGGLGFPAIYFGLVTLIGACCAPLWGENVPRSER